MTRREMVFALGELLEAYRETRNGFYDRHVMPDGLVPTLDDQVVLKEMNRILLRGETALARLMEAGA